MPEVATGRSRTVTVAGTLRQERYYDPPPADPVHYLGGIPQEDDASFGCLGNVLVLGNTTIFTAADPLGFPELGLWLVGTELDWPTSFPGSAHYQLTPTLVWGQNVPELGTTWLPDPGGTGTTIAVFMAGAPASGFRQTLLDRSNLAVVTSSLEISYSATLTLVEYSDGGAPYEKLTALSWSMTASGGGGGMFNGGEPGSQVSFSWTLNATTQSGSHTLTTPVTLNADSYKHSIGLNGYLKNGISADCALSGPGIAYDASSVGGSYGDTTVSGTVNSLAASCARLSGSGGFPQIAVGVVASPDWAMDCSPTLRRHGDGSAISSAVYHHAVGDVGSLTEIASFTGPGYRFPGSDFRRYKNVTASATTIGGTGVLSSELHPILCATDDAVARQNRIYLDDDWADFYGTYLKSAGQALEPFYVWRYLPAVAAGTWNVAASKALYPFSDRQYWTGGRQGFINGTTANDGSGHVRFTTHNEVIPDGDSGSYTFNAIATRGLPGGSSPGTLYKLRLYGYRYATLPYLVTTPGTTVSLKIGASFSFGGSFYTYTFWWDLSYTDGVTWATKQIDFLRPDRITYSFDPAANPTLIRGIYQPIFWNFALIGNPGSGVSLVFSGPGAPGTSEALLGPFTLYHKTDGSRKPYLLNLSLFPAPQANAPPANQYDPLAIFENTAGVARVGEIPALGSAIANGALLAPVVAAGSTMDAIWSDLQSRFGDDGDLNDTGITVVPSGAALAGVANAILTQPTGPVCDFPVTPGTPLSVAAGLLAEIGGYYGMGDTVAGSYDATLAFTGEKIIDGEVRGVVTQANAAESKRTLELHRQSDESLVASGDTDDDGAFRIFAKYGTVTPFSNADAAQFTGAYRSDWPTVWEGTYTTLGDLLAAYWLLCPSLVAHEDSSGYVLDPKPLTTRERIVALDRTISWYDWPGFPLGLWPGILEMPWINAYGRVTTEQGGVVFRRALGVIPPFELTVNVTPEATGDAHACLAADERERLWIAFGRSGDVYQVYSDDDGATWSDPVMTIAGGKFSRRRMSRLTGAQILAAVVDNQIHGFWWFPGDTGDAPALVTFKDSSGNPLLVEPTDAFDLEFAEDGQLRLVAGFHIQGESAVSDWWSEDDEGATWNRVS